MKIEKSCKLAVFISDAECFQKVQQLWLSSFADRSANERAAEEAKFGGGPGKKNKKKEEKN
ncbi:hypothetical protein CRG98_032709 [Punica granatum]|uniref:Uncharacterized protein n=1 Tax=Punica granatum TaxID=22663 RepID=A0A2I0ISB6_PUNGR|nr:hypothetical protein CRG98_032709 [Punica granatum]